MKVIKSLDTIDAFKIYNGVRNKAIKIMIIIMWINLIIKYFCFYIYYIIYVCILIIYFYE